MTGGVDNPLNVRRNQIEWQGEVDGSGAFADFDGLVDGLRAGMLCILSAFRRHSCDTVYDLVKRYAPPSDNNPTGAYARFVANRLGVRAGVPGDPEPGTCLDFADPEILQKTAAAMAWWETHSVVAADVLRAACQAALAHIGL